MEAEERFYNKRIGYVKSCINKKYGVPLYSISLNWNTKHVSVKGQIVVKTCQDGSLKFSKYQDVEDEVDELMPKIGRQKTHRNDCEQSRKGVEKTPKRERLRVVKGRLQHRETKTKARGTKRNPKTNHQYKEETANMTLTKKQEEPTT